MKRVIVVIDGPAGAGKSTAARRLAKRLDAFYLDTGAMYRACTLRALRSGTDLEDAQALAEVVDSARIRLENGQVFLDGEDVSQAIRTREVTHAIHYLANNPGVRERLVAQQQRLGRETTASVVAEGRDLGSIVFPDADVKVYLDALAAERARRRRGDLDPADAPSLEQLQEEIETRDLRDTKRLVGPLVRVTDATYLDTSSLSLDQVVERLVEIVLSASQTRE